MPRAFFVIVLAQLTGRCYAVYDNVHHLESARVYGNIDKYGYYFVDMLVGTPPQRVSAILESSSSTFAFPCKECTHCGTHIDSSFDLVKSSSAEWLPCDSRCHSACKEGHCSYHSTYTEGSTMEGYWFTDYARVGDASQRNPAVMIRMGCHRRETKLFYTQKANGILGIGPSTARGGGQNLLQALFRDTSHVDGRIFSMCLAEWGGRLVVGGYNASYHVGPIHYVPLKMFGDEYRVPLTGMRIGSDGRVISLQRSACIDSGTTYTYMATKPYRELRRAIEAHHGKRRRPHGDCWLLNGSSDLRNFPDIEVFFGSVTTVWVPKAYLFRKSRSNRWCYAFYDDGPNANTLLGATWMLHQDIVFDLSKKSVGIVRAKCPEHRERPPHSAGARPGLPTTVPESGPWATTVLTTSTTSASPIVSADVISKPVRTIDALENLGAEVIESIYTLHRQRRKTPVITEMPEEVDLSRPGTTTVPEASGPSIQTGSDDNDGATAWFLNAWAIACFAALVAATCAGIAVGVTCHARLLRSHAREVLLSNFDDHELGEGTTMYCELEEPSTMNMTTSGT